MSIAALVIGATGALVTALVWRRRRRAARTALALQTAHEEGLLRPASLHPVIDSTVCIGSFSCIKACPEGEIIGVVDGVATLVRGADCIGHGRCAQECPVSAIKLVMGSAEVGVDLPHTSSAGESSRPGVFVIGELAGMGLIKNAVRQGLQLADELVRQLQAARADAASDVVDVAIVGAGPAGITCAASCRRRGLRVALLEQESLGGAVAHYPRGKVVMNEAVRLPWGGVFGRAVMRKEEVLAELQALLVGAGVEVQEQRRVVGLLGAVDAFEVCCASSPSVRARRVVLACGLRGSPNMLQVPGETHPAVRYRLGDPAQYAGQRVVVVGGGDSALEAAIALHEQAAHVTLVHRGTALKARAANRQRFTACAIDMQLSTTVRALHAVGTDDAVDVDVELVTPAGPQRLRADIVVVCIGGAMPAALLDACGVSMRRLHGETPGVAAAMNEEHAARDRRRQALALFALGASLVSGLMVMGGDYYTLPVAERSSSMLHEWLRPAGAFGHGVGIVATAFMLANFLYMVRKRWRRAQGFGDIRSWLTWHMFVGVMSPVVIAFHAAFLANNVLAAWTWAALVVVVGTGVFGRFLFGLLPTDARDVLPRAEARQRLAAQEREVRALLSAVPHTAPLVEVLWSTAPSSSARSTVDAVLTWWHTRRQARTVMASVAQVLDTPTTASLVDDIALLLRSRAQVQLYRAVKRAFRAWLVVHVACAVVVVGLIAAHVGVTLWLGYRQVWT